MPITSEDICMAIESTAKTFPFPGYIGEESATHNGFLFQTIADYVKRPARLLDIGCGPMNVTAVFATLGYKCFAVDDLSDPWHKRDDNREKILQFANDNSITFHQQTPAFEVPFEEASFDVVVMKSIIEHLHQSPRDLINTAFRFVKPGGYVVVTTPNSVNLRKRLSVLRGRTNYPPIQGFYESTGVWRGHVREYTLDELRWVVEASGGDVKLASTFHGFIEKVPRRFRKPYVFATNYFTGIRDSLLVLAERPVNWEPSTYSDDKYWDAIAPAVPSSVLGS